MILNQQQKTMHLLHLHGPLWWPWWCAGAIPRALPNTAGLGIPYAIGGHHRVSIRPVWFWCKKTSCGIVKSFSKASVHQASWTTFSTLGPPSVPRHSPPIRDLKFYNTVHGLYVMQLDPDAAIYRQVYGSCTANWAWPDTCFECTVSFNPLRDIAQARGQVALGIIP